MTALLAADPSDASLGSLWAAETVAPSLQKVGAPAPEKWAPWLAALFPGHVRAGFTERHIEFWRWVWAIERHSSPDPFVGVWPRGGGKSTSAELAACALGVRNKRRYGLYVRETQAQADNSIGNVGRLLESDGVARHYPEHAERSVGKFGNVRGWRRERLLTAGGLAIDAIGLDVASRGLKIEDQRPDFVVFDDIDGKHDSPAVTEKKIQTITTSILPAGASNVAVLGIQNLIIPDGVFTRMVDGRAEYLAKRIVSGPHPAVRGLRTEPRTDPQTGVTRHLIVAGEATWAGQSLEVAQKQIDEWGVGAFRKEAQHEVSDRKQALAVVVPNDALVDLTDDQVRRLVAMGQAFGSIDYGHWRFAFLLHVPDQHGRLHVVHEYFDQRDDATGRAQTIHAICQYYGVLALMAAGHQFPIWGDAANPSDAKELNAAWRRRNSPLVTIAVGMMNKARAASVERLTDHLGRGALLFRRTLGTTIPTPGAPAEMAAWQLGMNAGGQGVEMRESRLLWELGHWQFPVPKPGELQSQDPDDNTADGADCTAALRYGAMSYWQPGTVDRTRSRTSEDQHPGAGRRDPAPARPAAPERPETAAPWPGAWDGHTAPTGYREIA